MIGSTFCGEPYLLVVLCQNDSELDETEFSSLGPLAPSVEAVDSLDAVPLIPQTPEVERRLRHLLLDLYSKELMNR